VTLWDRARYSFDNSMAHGPSALVWYLGAAVALIVVLFTLLILLFGSGPTGNPVTAGYQVLLHTLDTGTIAGDQGTGYIVLQLLVTVLGIFIFSAFIGVIANAIDARLTELRKGRSLVLEQGHTLILGWGESIFTVISELAIANESRSEGACVVVLADEDKATMDDSIRARVPDLAGTRVVCRSGSPTAIADLDLVAHASARSVIVLRPEVADPDIYVIKALLALTRAAVPGRHIVAEIADPHNLDAARAAGKGEAEILDRGTIASRLIVQTSRQSGAARIYEDLFDFAGHEIYQRVDPGLVGRSYGELLLAYEDCSVIGISNDGDVRLNPPVDTVLADGARIVAIAEDDSVLDVAAPFTGSVDDAAIVDAGPREEPAETTLVLGWSDKTATVLRSLDDFAPHGSRAEIVALNPPDEERLKREIAGFARLTVSARTGDSADAAVLESLGLERFDRVIVMCDDRDDWDRADGRVLLSLIHLREIAQRTGARFKIVSELMDEADRDLAEVARVDDVVISEQVISYLLAQISENRDLAEVFAELLDADGSEVYLRPAGDYVRSGAEVDFATIVAAGRRRGETVIGYRKAAWARDPEADFGIHLNPPKSAKLAPVPDDSVIVLSEN
jgi:voltage-gated potassium channel Kch